MPRRTLSQTSFFNPAFALPRCLKPGSVPWLLARYRSRLFPAWLFSGWYGAKRLGRNAWPAPVLMTLVILRWTREGMSRRACVREAEINVQWRAAMGLEIGAPTPSEKRLRVFERFLGQRHPECDVPRYLLLHEHIVRLCIEEGVVGDDAVWAMDSTPMWCYGAVLDTVRQLGDGLRMLARDWARATGTTLGALAKQWKLALLVAKSTKGALRIDWRDADARKGAVEELARKVLDVVSSLRKQIGVVRPNKRKGLLRRCRNLLRVVSNDFETDEEGRLVVAKRVAKDRLVSITDPQARHGRKSRRQTFNGFKTHLLGDVVSGLIVSLSVTAGNVHDGVPAHRLIHRAKGLRQEIDQILGDTAYGGARLRHVVRGAEHVTLVAPPQPLPPDVQARRAALQVNLDAGTAVCANGVEARKLGYRKFPGHAVPVPTYYWPKDTCAVCTCEEQCCCENHRGLRLIRLHLYERELRASRATWQRPEIRESYRARSQCERLVNQITRHGGRRARAWGLGTANLQAHSIAMRCNLELLARRLHEAPGRGLARAA
jgi:hypothetical protein